jgi:hypothetical protein
VGGDDCLGAEQLAGQSRLVWRPGSVLEPGCGGRNFKGRDNVMRWILIAMLASAALADDSGKAVYTDSFKKGATRVTEQALEVTLTPGQAKQDFKVLDAAGKQRYILRFVPDTRPGDTRILGWFVRLADIHHKIYDSVLPTSPDLARDQAQAWWLDARQFSKVPLQARRVFKVEQFYCVVQVKDVKRSGPGQPYLNQMNVAVQLTNTKP